MMIWVDYCILVLLLLSLVVGVVRGFAREVFGLVTWVAAIWIAVTFVGHVEDLLQPHISVPSVRAATSYAILFLGGLLIGGILTSLIVRALRESALSSTDRTLGAGFGLLRGAVLVAVFILVAGMTPARQDPWWQQSLLLGKFEWLADGLRVLIPESWLDRLKPENDASASPATHVSPY